MSVQRMSDQVILFPVPESYRREVMAAKPVPTGLHGLRLTRRGRVLVWIASLVLVAVLGAWAGSAAAAGGVPEGEQLQAYAVERGDTLWEIAKNVAPHVDPREVVHDIMSLNNLPDATLVAGQTLYVPQGIN